MADTTKTASPAVPVTDSRRQAGGGVSGEAQSVKALKEPILRHLSDIFKFHADKNDKAWHKDQLTTFLKHVQGDQETSAPPELLAKADIDMSSFIQYITSTSGNIMAPLPAQDLSWPLSNYFISSSHNTYLTGNQLYSDSSTDAYKNVLLRGCRCIEIDVWDGDESDSDSSSDESENGSDNVQKRKDMAKKAKDKLPSSLTSRLEKTSLGKRFEKYVEQKTQAKPTTAAPVPAEKPAAAGGNTAPRGGGAGGKAATTGATAATATTAAATPLTKTTTKGSTITEPRVLHGYTLTKEVSFRDVCVAIRDHAFAVSDLPLIVSLEVHCGAEQQEMMVNIMEEVWKGLLVSQPTKEADILPPPGELRKKILVKVKYAPPTKDAATPASPEVDLEHVHSEENHLPPEAAKKKAKKPSKIIQALSQLGIYTRGVSFKSLEQPEASMPTHVFSLSEKGVMEVHQKSGPALFHHNKSFLMRTYPSGLRITSSNLDPVVFWRKGIQIVALNWQNTDEGMMLNEGMFAGSPGMILKPEGYRSEKTKPATADAQPYFPISQATAVPHKTLDLTISVLAAQSLPLPPKSKASSFHPYLKVELHVEEPAERQGGHVENEGKEKEGEYKARTKTYKGVDPDFKAENLEFKAIPGVVEELAFARFIVKDDEIMRDDLAAWACVRLDRLRIGYRFVHLLDSKGRETDGVVLVKVAKKLY